MIKFKHYSEILYKNGKYTNPPSKIPFAIVCVGSKKKTVSVVLQTESVLLL